MKSVKESILAGVRRLGFDITRRQKPLTLLRNYPIRTVIDVGANAGQFAAQIRAVFPSVRMHCFEPLPTPFRALHQRMQADPLLHAHQLAIGNTEGLATMNEFAFSPSSSLLPSAPLLIEKYDWAASATPREVRMTTLDKWTSENPVEGPLLVKIDVQGYEDRVVEGARQTLARASVLVVEVSFVELYRGQVLFDDLYAMLRGLGFRCAGMMGNLIQDKTGQILQADAVFLGAAT